MHRFLLLPSPLYPLILPLCIHADIDQSFHCRDGRAYLFNAVVNTLTGPKEERFMTTGLHTVVDVHCNVCMQLVGWKYVRYDLAEPASH